MAIPASAVESLQQFTKELDSINDEIESEASRLRGEYRGKMEGLFQERQLALSKVDGFWGGILSSPNSPLAPLQNGTIDSKITRAITNFQVLTTVKGSDISRKVVITFRQNMYCEEGEVHREIDTSLKTTSLSTIKWKQGTERARQDSLFTFFEEKPREGDEFVVEAVEAFDILYQNPFLAID